MRFLRPDPDALTVTGPDNSSNWLMLLVRSDAIHRNKILYFIALAVEVFFLIAGFGLHIRGFVMFWKLKAVHINLLLTVAGMYALNIVGSIARLLTIPYEARLVQFEGLYEAPIPLLAYIRQAGHANAFYILWAVSVERTCATLFVADYEKRRRLSIAVIINLAIVLGSCITGYAVVAGLINPFIFMTALLATNFLCAITFRWLIRNNERRLARLTDQLQRFPEEYTLSLRVQLKENIWSMRKIEFGVYLLTFGLFANLAVVCGPILILTAPGQFELLQWFTCLGNLQYAGVITKAPSKIREIDGYFKELESQWNHGLSVHNR